MNKRFSEEQIIGFLRVTEASVAVIYLCRLHGFRDASDCPWRSQSGGMGLPETKRLKELEAENPPLKKLLSEQSLVNEVIEDAP